MVGHIQTALTTRFQAPEWALSFEVRNATGYGSVTRFADALAMNLYPSRGLEIHGVEIKVSRSDWLRELKDPEKSAPIQQYCDRWWLAVDDAAIVKEGELPVTWGLLVLQKGGKLVQKIAAPKLESKPVTREFLASIFRSVTATMVPSNLLDRLAQKQVDERMQRYQERESHKQKSLEQDVHHLNENIRIFQEVSGIKIDSYHGPKDLGEAVRKVLFSGKQKHSVQVMHARQRLASIVEELDSLTKVFSEDEAAQ